ncbi:immunomodulatory protein [Dichomitus squalens]|uniref:Immunomodulatory protein n=1 Tax=Dichomitus squalens TaxID=114155 RepID=A0A4Q9MVQ6_9APHY|nr:immunomodulatory protein [Dichomitus squalens]TBU47519.1 immunomodulatory protein [Dichomitus squalens]TBU60571.1 immunomodulatory protein [Dichomitus squalens]
MFAPLTTATIFALVWTQTKICFDYTPDWIDGGPRYINGVVFPKVLTDKNYSYRVESDRDYGVRAGYQVQADGSQKVNFLDYNYGLGIEPYRGIKVYVVDPDDGKNYLVAELEMDQRERCAVGD